MFKEWASKLNISLHHCFSQFLHTTKKLTAMKYWYLKVTNYTTYIQRQLNYLKPQIQETLKAYNDI